LSWKYIETPFRSRWSIDRWRVFSVSATLSLIFLAIGLLINASDGLESRFGSRLIGDVGQLEFHQYIDDKFFDCEPKSVAAKALSYDGYLRCKQSKIGVPDVVLLGDSHAEHLFIGLAEAEPNLNVAFYISSGAPLIENVNFKAVFDELLNNGESQRVLVTFAYGRQISFENQKSIFESLELTVVKLIESKKIVSLLSDVPSFQINPELCKFGYLKVEVLDLCYISVKEVTESNYEVAAEVKALSRRQNIKYFEINHVLCNQTSCGMIKDGQVLYRDDNHLNILGSRVVGRYLSTLLNS